MKNRMNKLHDCLKIKHIVVFTFCTLVSLSVFSKELTYLVRKPASTPDDEVITAPAYDKSMVAIIFADDDAGVMAEMRNSLSNWEKVEEYRNRWNLESTLVYRTPTTDDKRKFLANKLLKYADKRLAGEIKNADEGSTLHTVGKVEKTLRPNTTVAVSNLISLKFKARVLQGKAIMEVRNPWLEVTTTVNGHGEVKLLTQKEFKSLGLTSGVEYTANHGEWIAFADQAITQNIKARVSSTQKDQSILNNDAEKKLEMTASFPLNF